MQLPSKDALIKAFHHSAVVVIDEANSIPGMKDLLNSLLMGKTPEGECPVNPGFMVICTQNPAKTTQGRGATSTDAARRHYTEVLSRYPEDEMEAVLLHKLSSQKLPLLNKKALVAGFIAYTRQAIREKHLRLPTFDDILQEAHETFANPVKEALQNLLDEDSASQRACLEKTSASESVFAGAEGMGCSFFIGWGVKNADQETHFYGGEAQAKMIQSARVGLINRIS
jgi:hypothetical protein